MSRQLEQDVLKLHQQRLKFQHSQNLDSLLINLKNRILKSFYEGARDFFVALCLYPKIITTKKNFYPPLLSCLMKYQKTQSNYEPSGWSRSRHVKSMKISHDLSLPPKERKLSKRRLWAIGRTICHLNQLKIIYQILLITPQVTNKWVVILTKKHRKEDTW